MLIFTLMSLTATGCEDVFRTLLIRFKRVPEARGEKQRSLSGLFLAARRSVCFCDWDEVGTSFLSIGQANKFEKFFKRGSGRNLLERFLPGASASPSLHPQYRRADNPGVVLKFGYPDICQRHYCTAILFLPYAGHKGVDKRLAFVRDTST